MTVSFVVYSVIVSPMDEDTRVVTGDGDDDAELDGLMMPLVGKMTLVKAREPAVGPIMILDVTKLRFVEELDVGVASTIELEVLEVTVWIDMTLIVVSVLTVEYTLVLVVLLSTMVDVASQGIVV